MAFLKVKKTAKGMPSLGTEGWIDFGYEDVLKRDGAVYYRKKDYQQWENPEWEKGHYAFPLPNIDVERIKKYSHDEGAGEVLEAWEVYLDVLGYIKKGDSLVTNDVLVDNGVDDDFFAREPKPHQKDGLAFFLLSNEIGNGSILLFDEMRTGKTKQAIDIARWLLREELIRRVLVICPNSIKEIWQDEIQLDAPDYGLTTIVEGTKAQRKAKWNSRFIFYIISYDIARIDVAEMQHWASKMNYYLICDEAHKLKNPEAKQTQAVMSLLPNYQAYITGTPVSNKPEDIWTIGDATCRGMLGKNIYAFRNRFAVKGGFKGKQIVDWKDIDVIQKRLACVSLRRRRRDIMLDETIYQDRKGEMTKEQASSYEMMREALWAQYSNGGQHTSVRAVNGFTQALRLYQISDGYLSPNPDEVVWFENSWKLQEIDEFLDEYLDDIGKVVIWSRFVPVIKKLHERYEEQYGALMIRGQMGREAIDNMYKFQRDPAHKVMIAQIQTSEGKGFQPATFAIMYDMWLSPYLNDQARDRIVGIKNPVPVTIIRLITKDAIDERILYINKEKRNYSGEVLGEDVEEFQISQGMSKEMLLYILANPEEAEGWKKKLSDSKMS